MTRSLTQDFAQPGTPATVRATLNGKPVTDTDIRFLQALWDSIVDKGSDYCYPRAAEGFSTRHGACVYSQPNGQPACLVGHGLYRLDPSFVPRFPMTMTAFELLMDPKTPLPGLSPAVVEFVSALQLRQDRGFTWGAAWGEGRREALRYGLQVEAVGA